MAGKDLEKVFLEAAEIAQKLPKNLQEAGFNKAVEQLLGKGGTPSDRRHRGKRRTTTREASEQGDTPSLIEQIDRTAHPDIGATARVADRALKVLQLAHDDYGVDGLTAAEIAKILSEKFRLPTKANSVLVALERETDTTDVRGTGASKLFHIMAPGEAYLEKLRSGEVGGTKRRRGTRSSKKKTGRRKKKASTKKTGDKKRAAGRPGPKAAVAQLLAVGFFRSTRTISEIQEELRHRRGHTYSVQELSPALVRSVRDESLSRERNSEGQYEYISEA